MSGVLFKISWVELTDSLLFVQHSLFVVAPLDSLLQHLFSCTLLLVQQVLDSVLLLQQLLLI
ncbi:hypothetical protein CD144_05505 [Staphylococcus equorum subsp. linens]|nr:hypothetical protein CD144_05505 [Staphylococcus equorum subsp. linens]